jgi:integrase
VQRGVVHGRVDVVKTEYSNDDLPLDPELTEILLSWKRQCLATPEGWVFSNPGTPKPYWQESVCKKYIKPAAVKAELGGNIGWHTFRHTYRTWLDSTGAPVAMQRELMRHASIETTMNVYGRATMSDAKRQANSKVVQMALRSVLSTKAESRSL